MLRRAILVLVPGLLVGACIQTALPPVPVAPRAERVSYLQDVAPILDRRCVVCHSCYNAACQLKLSSYEGVDRGGSKLPVYDNTRLTDQAPTRLFFDAQTTAEWRKKGFHSVTGSSAEGEYNDSLMLYLLDAKRKTPQSLGEYHPEAADLTCAANPKELGAIPRSATPSAGCPSASRPSPTGSTPPWPTGSSRMLRGRRRRSSAC